MESSSQNNHDPIFSALTLKFAEYLRAVQGKSVHTVSAYARDLTAFFEYLEKIESFDAGNELTDVNADHITSYLKYLGGSRIEIEGEKFEPVKVSTRTRNRKLSAIKKFFGYCIDENLVEADPTTGIKGPRQETKLPVYLEVEEIQRLLKSIPSGELKGLRDRALIECLYSTGLRVSELVSLNVRDFPSSGDTMKVIGKRGKERIVFLGEHAVDSIVRYLDIRRNEGESVHPDSPLFTNNREGRLTSRSIQRIISERAEQAGITREVTPHSLRHSFATHMLSGGADIRTLQELLGHARLSTVQIYTHLSLDEVRKKYLQSHPLAK
ncbi:MAG TPA: site-specific tyrosine recombinase/integron integrase [bacterium]|jgi:site-specific recombinase XerD